MPDLLANKAITQPKYRFVHRGVIWSFKDDLHNPVMQEKLRQGRYTAALSPAGVTLQSEDKHQAWQVSFDSRGFVLRGNGLRHRINDSPVNALHRTKTQERIYLSFWDLVLQRDRAPVENRRMTDLGRFNRALSLFLSEFDQRIFDYYAKAQVGERGDIRLRASPHSFCLWGLALMRRHAGKRVLLVPLRNEDNLSLAVYRAGDRGHLYTFQFDPEAEQFYNLREKAGTTLKEFFAVVTRKRHFSYRGQDYYFNNKAVVGDVYTIEDDGKCVLVRRGDQSFFVPSSPIMTGSGATGHLLGGLWPTSPLPITGAIDKAVPFWWRPADRTYICRVLGRQYLLTSSDLIRLKLKGPDSVFITVEDGLVVEVRSKHSDAIVYNRTIRDEKWKLLGSKRASVARQHLTDGVRIIEGLDTFKTHGRESVKIGGSVLSLRRKAGKYFTSGPASVVARVKNGSARLIHWNFTPRFSPEERRQIDSLLLQDAVPSTLNEFRLKHQERREQLARLLRLHPKLDKIRELCAGNDIIAPDIVNLIDIIYILTASKNDSVSSQFSEIYSHLHEVFIDLFHVCPVKTRLALKMMQGFSELNHLLEIMMFNLKNGKRAEQLNAQRRS